MRTRLEWNYAGTFLAVMSLIVFALWHFGIIEFERAIIALGVLIIFGLIYIGTQLMGVRDDIYGKK